MMTTKEYGLLIMNRIMKSKIYEFDPVLYPFPILVTKDFDKEELKSIYKTLDSDYKEVSITDEFDAQETTTATVFTVIDSKSGLRYYLVLLYRPEVIGAGTAAHEAVHLANAYLQYLGFSSPASYNDEPYAYFVQWVTNCIWSVLNDEPDKMKGKLYEVEKG